jgi:hypothetical protein
MSDLAARAKETGERYAEARQAVKALAKATLSSPFLDPAHPPDYEVEGIVTALFESEIELQNALACAQEWVV